MMPSKGIVYYTDNRLPDDLALPVRKLLLEVGFPIVSVSLAPIEFGTNLVLPLERGYLAMFKQILVGLETIGTDITYLCEHDVLYHASHFLNSPSGLEYNQNVWKVNHENGHAIHYPCSQVSGLSAPTALLLDHYTKRVARVESNGFSMRMGFEPGTHHRPERVDDLVSSTWFSDYPNVDIRHSTNLSKTKWSPSDFRNPKYAEGWTESDTIPGWGHYPDFLKDLSHV